MKRRIITAILMLCTVFALCACGGNTGNTEKENTQDSQMTESEKDSIVESEEDGKVVYKVTVVDADGNPVAGAMVQICKDACVPGKTGDNGVAEFNLEETDGYKVSVLSLPEGYVYEGDAEVYLESGETELTLTVNAAQ